MSNTVRAHIISGAILVGCALGLAAGVPTQNEKSLAAIEDLLKEVPLIDGHNDLPWQLFNRARNQLETVDLYDWPQVHTDIPRLRKGMVGGQFWALYVSCNTQYRDGVRACLDQADVIHRFVEKYNETFQLATTVNEIWDAFNKGKIASLIGMEGGHCLDSSLATLRMFYDLGVRYMTVTHSCNTPWADNWMMDGTPAPQVGLTPFGRDVIVEMNRLGMLIDLSHVSVATMREALELSVSPVIFSHSSVFSICNSYRNVPDDILELTKLNRGIVMVNFYNNYVTCGNNAALKDVADHIDYIKRLIGADYVGIGGDYDGVSRTPTGLEDVSKYPDLFVELRERFWTDMELKKLAGLNLIRVLEENERVSKELKLRMKPLENIIPNGELVDRTCRTIGGSGEIRAAEDSEHQC